MKKVIIVFSDDREAAAFTAALNAIDLNGDRSQVLYDDQAVKGSWTHLECWPCLRSVTSVAMEDAEVPKEQS